MEFVNNIYVLSDEEYRAARIPEQIAEHHAEFYALVVRTCVIPELSQLVRDAHAAGREIDDRERIAICRQHMLASQVADQLHHKPCAVAGH